MEIQQSASGKLSREGMSQLFVDSFSYNSYVMKYL